MNIERHAGALRASIFLLVLAFLAHAVAAHAQDPGKATAIVHGDNYTLSNDVIASSIAVTNNKIETVTVTDKRDKTLLLLANPFAILLKDGTLYKIDNLQVAVPPQVQDLTPNPDASRYSDRLPGKQFNLQLACSDGNLRLTWSVVLRDDSHYIRQFITATAGARDVPISRVQLIDLNLPGAQVIGSVKGSPIVQGNLFFGFEHPLSDSKVSADRATAYIDRNLPLKAGQSVTYSSVIGIAQTGQLRRDFLSYLERERAHPYRTFLHYNSWYDLGYFNPYDQAGALDRINTFGRELHEKRGVTLDSFMFDDGWDNHASLWSFNKGFPSGFTPVREAANKYGAAPGIWMSPWGGYDGPKKERIQFGKQQGFEIVDNGFALSGPKYYARFRDVCMDMIRKHGVNQFKFDGTGNANSVFPGSAFDSDFSAAIHLIGELREVKPDIYINLTTGTYPSPFWLLYADSTWRGGEDDDVAGIGSYRERWITYRDADTYDHIVKAGPLYPLNSLMLHGMIYAQHHKDLGKDPNNDFRNEIRDYFGNGTQLQEMYITPSLLTSANWDDLAEAAKWSRANADVLKDTHWIGGDPTWLEVYGWASWSAKKGILVLRNPSDHSQNFKVDIQEAFELPSGAPQGYTAKSPWKDDASKPTIELRAHSPYEIQLAPFEVLTLDVTPQ
jgi:hypothetical protein